MKINFNGVTGKNNSEEDLLLSILMALKILNSQCLKTCVANS